MKTNKMPITSIQFSTSQESVNKIGLKSWKKFGAEYQIDTGENLEDAKKALKDFVYQSLKAQQDTVPEDTIQVKTETDTPQSTEAKIIAQIYGCSDLKVLESFKLLAQKKENIMAAYNQQQTKLIIKDI